MIQFMNNFQQGNLDSFLWIMMTGIKQHNAVPHIEPIKLIKIEILSIDIAIAKTNIKNPIRIK